MKILYTNDDGIDAPGIRALIDACPKNVEAIVVAPANEKSASSHSITIGEKLRVVERKGTKLREFEVHGTPADCVKIAIAEIKGFFPDLVISGVNQGANTGVSVYYSGTISAAREAFINRIPSIALSLCSRKSKDFRACQQIARQLIEGYQKGVIAQDVMLNVNLPPLAPEKIKGIRVTKQAESHFIEEFIEEKHHQNTKVYSLAGEIEIYDPDGTSDVEAVSEGCISITPLKLDLTNYQVMPILEQWIQQKKMKASKPKRLKKNPRRRYGNNL